MTITREQVADLHLEPGDVVEVVETCCGDEISHRGALRKEQGRSLVLGEVVVISEDGAPRKWFHSLTVVSRAPRPLYVNHPRTEPALGDVASDGISVAYYLGARWVWPNLTTARPGSSGLRLLVDGETGQVVP